MAALDENGIDDDLKTTAWYLSDIETLDMPWNEYERAGFSIEWADVIGRVRRLKQNQSWMNNEERRSFDELKRRFEAVKDKLKALDLENPLE